MNQLFDLLQGQLSDDMIDQLSDQLGGVNRDQTAVASKSLISTLVGGIAQNALQDRNQAESLNNALDRDHDGSILDDVMGFLGGQRDVQNRKMLDGEGIVNHVFQDQQRKSSVLDMVSRMSGMDTGKAGNLMSMLAPLVMGALGKTKRQQGLDVGGLMSLLSNTQTEAQSGNNSLANSLISSFLDQDGDGSAMDDVANMGMKMLGNFFK